MHTVNDLTTGVTKLLKEDVPNIIISHLFVNLTSLSVSTYTFIYKLRPNIFKLYLMHIKSEGCTLKYFPH
jgi:hypothetical protein